jgi:hypothetical protein
MQKLRKAFHHLVPALVTAATLLGGAGRAVAAGDTCFTFGYIGILQCNTIAIPPNSSTHTINMKIHSAWTTYQLRDNGNQFIIRQGRTGGGWHYETIGGLYNREQGYVLYCNAFAGNCELNNN